MSDKVAYWIARHLPRRIIYWCAIELGVHATQGRYSNQIVPDLLYMEVLNRWDSQEAQG